MGALSWIFGRKEAEQNYSNELNKKVGISYYPELIPKLKNDHRYLVTIFTEIKTAAVSQKFAKIPQLLQDFKSVFQTHLLDENVKFYAYIQQNPMLDKQTAEFIKDIRSEMNGIARAVVNFADMNIAIAPNSVSVGKFLGELDGIGDVLLKRVNTEETLLYTLYCPA